MPTFPLELQDHEIKTRKLFNAALEGDKWASVRVMVAHVFVQNSHSALSFDGIFNRIVASNYLVESEGGREFVKKELSKLVREKVLRSRRAGAAASRPSEKLWEVNF
jgi:hypothetical protein